LPGFGAPARQGRVAWMFPEPAADPGRGQPARRGGPFPGQAQVCSEGAGEAELGVGGDDQPGSTRSAAAGSRSFGAVQPRTCNEQGLEGVFKIETVRRNDLPTGGSTVQRARHRVTEAP